MSTMTADLESIAKAVQVHPRTILRAVTGERNTYWSPDHNPDLNVSKVASALGCNAKVLQRALRGADDLLKPDEAAKEVYVKPRTFRWRGYTPVIRHGGVVRYSRAKLIHEDFANWS